MLLVARAVRHHELVLPNPNPFQADGSPHRHHLPNTKALDEVMPRHARHPGLYLWAPSHAPKLDARSRGNTAKRVPSLGNLQCRSSVTQSMALDLARPISNLNNLHDVHIGCLLHRMNKACSWAAFWLSWKPFSHITQLVSFSRFMCPINLIPRPAINSSNSALQTFIVLGSQHELKNSWWLQQGSPPQFCSARLSSKNTRGLFIPEFMHKIAHIAMFWKMNQSYDMVVRIASFWLLKPYSQIHAGFAFHCLCT